MMEIAEIQEPRSAAEGSRQPARSMLAPRKPAPTRRQDREPSWRPLQKAAETGTQLQPHEAFAGELEEYFEGFVTEIADTEIRMSTVSSLGEEGDAGCPGREFRLTRLNSWSLGCLCG